VGLKVGAEDDERDQYGTCTCGMDLTLNRTHVHLEEVLQWRYTGDDKRGERVQRQGHEVAERGKKHTKVGAWRVGHARERLSISISE
jgi:hypothetical protein